MTRFWIAAAAALAATLAPAIDAGRQGDRAARYTTWSAYGGTPDQMFHAFDATTGKLLWEFKTSSGIEGPPSSFEVDGKQYVAVLTGWGADANGAGATVARLLGEPIPTVGLVGAVYVFAVD